jgi:hypothetical protein
LLAEYHTSHFAAVGIATEPPAGKFGGIVLDAERETRRSRGVKLDVEHTLYLLQGTLVAKPHRRHSKRRSSENFKQDVASAIAKP